MPDVPPAPDEAATLRAANARLREVIEAKAAGAAVLRAQLEACQAQLEELRAEVEALRARVRRNPRNSSRPPSSKGLAKPALRSLRRRSGRKPGRPKGQPGATLEMTDRPDEVVWHEPGRCAGCGAGLSGAPLARNQRRQAIDLPEQIRALVTEHRIICRRCPCGTVTAGVAPPGVAAPVQYGPRLSAACTSRVLREQAKQSQAEAARLARDAAHRLHARGLSLRDIGQALGVTFQRAKQLVDEGARSGQQNRI